MSLQTSGYKLVPSKPNANGLCTFKLIDIETKEVIAETDEPSTLEYALISAREIIEELENE